MTGDKRIAWLLALSGALSACRSAAPSLTAETDGARTALSGAEAATLAPCAGDLLAVDTTRLDRARQQVMRDSGVLPDVRLVSANTRPLLRNARVIQRALMRSYPPELRARRVEGSGTLGVLVGPDGRPVRWRIIKGTGYLELDRGAHRAAEQLEFYPATYEGCRVASWVELEFAFSSHE